MLHVADATGQDMKTQVMSGLSVQAPGRMFVRICLLGLARVPSHSVHKRTCKVCPGLTSQPVVRCAQG